MQLADILTKFNSIDFEILKMFQKLNKYKIIWFELEFLPSMNVELRLKMPWLTHNARTIQNVKFVQKFIFSFEFQWSFRIRLKNVKYLFTKINKINQLGKAQWAKSEKKVQCNNFVVGQIQRAPENLHWIIGFLSIFPKKSSFWIIQNPWSKFWKL